jgi:hypothetical protein
MATSSLLRSRRDLIVPALSTAGSVILAYEIWRRRSAVFKLDQEIQSHLSVGSRSKISLVNSEEEWNQISKEIKHDLEEFPFIGVDTEWVNNRGQGSPISMLQLATFTGHCVLVRLANMDRVPDDLKFILANHEIVKTGVGIIEDSNKLLVDHNLDLVGCVDLRHLAVRDGSVPGKLGLQSLAHCYLNVHLNKDWRIRSGNWESEELSADQINYAANDALVAINILWTLLHSHLKKTFLSSLTSYRLTQPQLVERYQEILFTFTDVNFTCKDWKRLVGGDSQDKAKNPSRLNSKARSNSTRKSPLYHNCQLQAPDGQVLCTCDIKKAEWYIKKGIGEKVCDDPLTVRLKFEPSGRPEGKAGEYYLSVKPNICVVCGAEESYLRKNVVPHEYRRYFPAVMKDHQSHDVLLLCVRCHQLSNLHDASLRTKLALECNAPIGTENDVKLRDNFDLKRVKSAGRALYNAKDKLPEQRKNELLQILKDHYKVEHATDEVILMASESDFHEENANYTPHSRAVVQHHLKEGDTKYYLQIFSTTSKG